MPKYAVRTVEVCTYTYLVEAESAADAEARWAEFGEEIECDIASTAVEDVTPFDEGPIESPCQPKDGPTP